MKTLDRPISGVFLYASSCDDPHMARVALATLGAALSVYAVGLALWEPGTLTLPVAVHVAIGWSFVAAGLLRGGSTPRTASASS
jgi:hypothetical protein